MDDLELLIFLALTAKCLGLSVPDLTDAAFHSPKSVCSLTLDFLTLHKPSLWVWDMSGTLLHTGPCRLLG